MLDKALLSIHNLKLNLRNHVSFSNCITMEYNMKIISALQQNSSYAISSLMVQVFEKTTGNHNFISEYSLTHRYVTFLYISHLLRQTWNINPQCFNTWRIIKGTYLLSTFHYFKANAVLFWDLTFNIWMLGVSFLCVIFSRHKYIAIFHWNCVSFMVTNPPFSCVLKSTHVLMGLHHMWSLNLGTDKFQPWCYISYWNRASRALI